MAKDKIQFPSKVDKNPSFMEKIMKMLNRTSQIIDSNGRVTHITYPLKKDFSKKQKESAETLIINDVTIFGEVSDNRYQNLTNLKKLVLGEGVLGVATDALYGARFEELVLSEDVTMIPEGAIRDSKIKRVTSPKFDISTDATNVRTDIYTDEDDRLHFIERGRFSIGEEDFKLRKGENMTEETRAAAIALTKKILFSTSKRDNTKTIFVYAPNLGSDIDYSVHAIADDFPMPEDSLKRIPDEKLIGILVNGVEELDLNALKQYTNLTRIVVGKDVKRVVKAKDTDEATCLDPDSKKVKLVEDGKQVYEQKTSTGTLQTISLASDTTLIMSAQQSRGEVEPEKPLARAAEEFAKKGVEEVEEPEK